MKLFSAYRRVWQWLIPIALVFLSFLLIFLGQRFQISERSKLPIAQQTEVTQIEEPIQPIPFEIALDLDKVSLGEKLFQDVRLSKDNRVSCLSCHSFNLGGADGRVRSIGINGNLTDINTPTIFNALFNFRLNWDGEFENLTNHLNALMTNPTVMGVEWEALIEKLGRVPEYVRAFGKLYSDGLTQANIKDALVVYEKSLYTPNSRFDRFLRGDKTALTKTEQEGYKLFKSYGCVSCHQGINVGGNMFQRFGVMGDYFLDRGKITPADWGRFNVTKNEEDRYVFRVPSLRNVELTAPYFHDGSAETLEKAIAIMTRYQLGRPLLREQIDLIAQFLRTLNGEYQQKAS
ncbi:MAG: cytochrome-c peroxidase [Xenococcaceae cyanobacterium]